MNCNKIVLLAINARYSHTSPAIRYLRESLVGAGVERQKIELLELSINEFIPQLLARVYEARPQILGVACYIWNIELVKQLLPLVKMVLPGVTIIAGGPEVSYETAEFMQELRAVDYVIRGEGEIAFPALVKMLLGDETKSDIPGVAYRKNDGKIVESSPVTVPMDEVPFLYREEELPIIRNRILYYEASRGCPFRCAYCLSCATDGVRKRSLQKVINELSVVVRHDVRQIKFVDRTANADKKYWGEILKWIIDLPDSVRTNFHFEIAAELLDEDILALLKQLPVGRVQLEAGIQSTNPAVLKNVQRVNDWGKLARVIKEIVSWHNIHIHVDLIAGLPGEDFNSFARSYNDAYSLGVDMLQVGFLKFLKGSAIMKSVAVEDYRYMPRAPYEVLSNRVISYGELKFLHTVEQLTELYYNAGRCRRSVAYLMDVMNVQPFEFYAEYGAWWEENDLHHVGHSPTSLYEHLYQWAAGRNFSSQILSELDEYLRLDALLMGRGVEHPVTLCWTDQKAIRQAAAKFWRSDILQKYIENYSFDNWRNIHEKYHIEVFKGEVMKKIFPTEKNEPPTALLVNYSIVPPRLNIIKEWKLYSGDSIIEES